MPVVGATTVSRNPRLTGENAHRRTVGIIGDQCKLVGVFCLSCVVARKICWVNSISRRLLQVLIVGNHLEFLQGQPGGIRRGFFGKIFSFLWVR